MQGWGGRETAKAGATGAGDEQTFDPLGSSRTSGN